MTVPSPSFDMSKLIGRIEEAKMMMEEQGQTPDTVTLDYTLLSEEMMRLMNSRNVKTICGLAIRFDWLRDGVDFLVSREGEFP